jgi:hypothetical protein
VPAFPLNSTVRLKIETFDGISMGANDSKKKSGPKPAPVRRHGKTAYGFFSSADGTMAGVAGGVAGAGGGVK